MKTEITVSPDVLPNGERTEFYDETATADGGFGMATPDRDASVEIALPEPVGFSRASAEILDSSGGAESVPAPDAAPAASTLRHGSVVIAAITSCTNTSNPSVMLAAGLLAKKANALGLSVPPHVKPLPTLSEVR